MANISAKDIKNLREQTGAGMMDCKKALAESDGNFEAAKDWLRKKGLSQAAKKSGRTAAEGVVAIAKDEGRAVVIELNSETDFVAKNEKFQQLASALAGYGLEVGGDLEALRDFTCPKAGKQVKDVVTDSIAVIGENINLRRSTQLSLRGQGVLATYIHNSVAQDMGKIAVLVALESEGDKAALEAVGKQVAMHIAAAKPEALDSQSVSAEAVERERMIFTEQARASGKPDNVIEKMIEGRIRKYYEQVALLDQIFVMDNKTKIAEFLKASEKDVGAPISISGYVLFNLGEGIEKEENNFAEEVAAAAKTA